MGKLVTTRFKVPELRRKVLMTAMFLTMFLAIYRIGFYVPRPIVDQSRLAEWQNTMSQSTADNAIVVE